MITQNHLNDLTEYTVTDGEGYAFSCANYGATLTSLKMPDKEGKSSNVLLQFNDLNSIISDQTFFFGKAIGRVGGRIKNGSVRLNNQEHRLPQNEGTNTLHGGHNGFHHLRWDAEPIDKGIKFSRLIHPEDDQFPGSLSVSVAYKWGENHQLLITFTGKNESDSETLFNPTLHSYFNLNNHPEDGLKNHELYINGHEIAELADDLIPTGKLLETVQTAFDFHEFRPLDQMIARVRQENNLDGFDHPFKVQGPLVAGLKNKANGRNIKIYSDRNALIVYTLNSITGSETVNGGASLRPHMAVAMEPQTLPDAIHQEAFGDIVLRAQEQKTYQIRYDLSVD